MINRKKKLRIIQFFLLSISLIILYFSYSNKFIVKEKIISEEIQEKVSQQIQDQTKAGDVFFNISYNGIDLSGNRYVLNAEEAINDRDKPEKIYMKKIDAVFYFKDETNLKIYSNEGIYNNKTLDMLFKSNIRAFYQNSSLIAENAEFLNTKGLLIVSDKISVKDENGILFADKLFFDLNNQTLNISAFENNKVNANINIK